MFKISWQLRPGIVVVYFLGALMEIGGSILTIYATAKIASILAYFLTTHSAPNIWWWLIADIAATIGIGFGFMLMSYARRVLYLQFGHWATVKFQAALCQVDFPGFYNETTRNKINKVAQGYTWQISNLAQNNLDLAYGILRFIAITVVVSQITWWIVPLIALFLIPSLIAESKLAKSQWFVWDSKGDERHVFWGFDFIMRQPKGQMELRSTQASKYALKKIDVMLEKFYAEQEHKLRQSHTAIVGTKMLEAIGTAIGSIDLLRQVLLSQISLNRYFFLSGALLRVGGALNNIFGSLARLQETLLFAQSFFELVDYKPVNYDTEQAIDISNEQDLHIVFDNVTFRYPAQEKPVFENLNLEIKPGEHVAIVGENGAGKTTLMKLLMRFYKPESGQILINGHNLNDIAIESWYSKIATLFQEFNQYPLPIDENIQIGRSEKPVNQSMLEKAAQFSGIDSLIKKYKYGWDTVLDAGFKKGIEPSGGQWQRVALARAFYRDAPILILDEPTSAIDANAEFNIFNSIFKEYQHRTTIIVSHRFSTVRRADRIVVIDKGKILEQGSHKELMKQKGLYHDLFSKQAEGYK
jgi:ATP-binding cassette subfamily B protein